MQILLALAKIQLKFSKNTIKQKIKKRKFSHTQFSANKKS